MNTHRYLDVYRLSIELVTGINKAVKSFQNRNYLV